MLSKSSGNKSLDNAMLYAQLMDFKDERITVAVAHTEQEVVMLVEAGFEYVTEFECAKIFRKRKL